MRYKYNEGYIANSSRRSLVFLKYNQEIETLLEPSEASYRNYSFDELYVDHPLVSIMEKYKNKRETDSLVYLTGLTGTGKTSLLKKVFKHYKNTVVIEDNRIVIPYTCDSMVGDAAILRERLSTLFFGVIDLLCHTYKIKAFNADDDSKSRFVNYLKERRIQFSVNQKGWRKITNEELIDQLFIEDNLELSLLALKYTLKDEGIPITNVVFIMDDVESVEKCDELLPIYLANKINTCLINRGENEKKKWCSTVVIACRHFIYRIFTTKRKYREDNDLIIQSRVDRETMESFAYDDNYDMSVADGMPTIQEIIHKRENAIEKRMNKDDAYYFKEICSVVGDIIGLVGYALLALNINDYRKTLTSIKRILTNRNWLQKVEDVHGAFKLGKASEIFYNNAANIWRALAIGENEVYSEDESIVPNLLHNRRDGGDLWVLLAFVYFMKNGMKHSWNNSFDRCIARQDIYNIFPEDNVYIEEFEKAVNYLIKSRVLLRGKIQEQRDSINLDDNDCSTIQFFYPSTVMKVLWEQLGEKSILFEIMLDDVWIDEDIKVQREKRRKFHQFSTYNFRACLQYLSYLVNTEEKIRIAAGNRGTLGEFIRCFGQVHVTYQLFLGLKKSYNSYFKTDIPREKSIEQREFEATLNEIEKKISNMI